MKKATKYLALILAVAMVTCTACGGGTTETTSAITETTASGQTEAGERWINVNASLPLNYDPAVGSSSIDSSIAFNVYDTLVFTEIDGTVKPNVATEWSCSDDGLTWTFKIREGIKFHDGSVLDAEDVAFTINRVIAIGEGFAYLWSNNVESAEAPDSTTVLVHLSAPYAVFPATCVRMAIVNKDQIMANIDKSDTTYGEFGDYAKGWMTTHDAGSGPFMTKEISVTDYVTCERFDDYWQGFGTNPPDGFTVRAINEGATVLTMMSNGELNLTDEWETQDTYAQLAKMEGVEVAKIYFGAIMTMEMNTQKAPTDDVHFRKCLAYLYDYTSATEYIYPGCLKAEGPVSTYYEGSISKELNTYNYNLEKAKEELALSKYADNPGEFPVEIQYSADVQDEEDLCLLLQQAAAGLGINVTITSTPWATMMANAATVEATPSISVMAPSDSYSEAGAALKLRYHSSTCGTFQQFEWIQDKKLDTMIEDALKEGDHDKRMALYGDAQRYIDDLCTSIWILEWPEQRAYRADQFKWPEANAEKNAPIMGRSLYFRTIEFLK